MKQTMLIFLLTAICLPRTFATEPAINVNNYQWKGNPIILKTSQVFTGEDRTACGRQEYEICVGAAEPKAGVAPVPSPAAITVKCFIPKNETRCPPIKTEEQCFVASVGTPNPASRPQCDARASSHGRFDNLTFGCHCGLYGRRKDIRQTGAICEREMRDRITRAAARAEREAREARVAADEAALAGERAAAARTCVNGTWSHDYYTDPATGMCICSTGFHHAGEGRDSPCVADFVPDPPCGVGVTSVACTCDTTRATILPGGTCPASNVPCSPGFIMVGVNCVPEGSDEGNAYVYDSAFDTP